MGRAAGTCVVIAAAHLAPLFAALGQPATWRAGGDGDGVATRVIISAPDMVAEVFGQRDVVAIHRLKLRVADISALSGGDTVSTAASSYLIIGQPMRDATRLLWIAEAVEVEG